MKKGILALLLLLLCYLLIGSIAPYTSQPTPTAQTQDSFQASDCYGEDTGSDRAAIIDDNQAALELRLQMISHAQEQLILSTFDFRSDQAGTDLLAALLDAGERGVQVRLLVDGFSAFLRMERNPLFYALSSHPNIEIRVYNPIQLWKPWNLMGRLHDKYLIADHTAYLLGGRNCFNSFLGSYGGGQNRDRDVLVYNAGNVSDSSLYQVEDYYRSISALDCCKLFHDDEDLAARSSVQAARETLHQRLAELKTRYLFRRLLRLHRRHPAHPEDHPAVQPHSGGGKGTGAVLSTDGAVQEREKTGHPPHPLRHRQRLDDGATEPDRLQGTDFAQLCRHQRQPLRLQRLRPAQAGAGGHRA